MTERIATWDAVTLDDTGEPVTVSTYNIYRDGALVDSKISPRQYVFDVAPGETATIEVAAVGPGGEGPAAAATVVEPSGIPVAPTNLVIA